MRALLIINQSSDTEIRLIVRLHTNTLVQQVSRLVYEARDKEAFKLICKKGEVEEFVPPGRKIAVKPEFTFVEAAL